MVEARQHPNGSKRGSCFMLGSQRSHCHYKKVRAVLTASRVSGGKNKCQVRLTRIERALEYWMGTEIGTLGAYCCWGTVTARDGSDQKGRKMGAGYVNLRGKKKRQQRKVGRGERGSSLKPSGTSGLCLGIPWHPFDNLHALFVWQLRWADEGVKAMLVGAPDTDILREAIKEL